MVGQRDSPAGRPSVPNPGTWNVERPRSGSHGCVVDQRTAGGFAGHFDRGARKRAFRGAQNDGSGTVPRPTPKAGGTAGQFSGPFQRSKPWHLERGTAVRWVAAR